MCDQLGHLLEANDSQHITLQVLPFSQGAHGAALGSFVILGGVETSLDVVYVDLHVGPLFMEKTKNSTDTELRSTTSVRKRWTWRRRRP
jgi:hypothetical protein